VTSDDADKIVALERLLHAPLERLTLQGFDYARPAPEREPPLSLQPRRYCAESKRPVKRSRDTQSAFHRNVRGLRPGTIMAPATSRVRQAVIPEALR
jgi:hypothetical protein